MTCPYCDRVAELVTGSEVYPHREDLGGKWFYRCEPCDARVGCHPDTTLPLGRLANAELRHWKQQAHRAFDPLWRGSDTRRSTAYIWLAGELGIAVNACHIGMFDVEQCKEVVRICSAARAVRNRQPRNLGGTRR